DKVRWVRLNPDPLYVAQMARMNPGNFIDNKPNAAIDATAMDGCLEPEGVVPDYIFMDAAAAELSDRLKANKLGDLTATIAAYTYGVEPPPEIKTPSKTATGKKP